MAFNRIKNIRKGIEGAVLAGGAVEAVIQTIEHGGEVDVTQFEHAVTVIVAAGVGFLFKSIQNWLKNRNKE